MHLIPRRSLFFLQEHFKLYLLWRGARKSTLWELVLRVFTILRSNNKVKTVLFWEEIFRKTFSSDESDRMGDENVRGLEMKRKYSRKKIRIIWKKIKFFPKNILTFHPCRKQKKAILKYKKILSVDTSFHIVNNVERNCKHDVENPRVFFSLRLSRSGVFCQHFQN